MMTYNPNFDLDLQFGLIYERKLERLLREKSKIEIKTERDTWAKTGNIAIEVNFKGKPSGLAATKADWWFHILSDDNKVKGMLCLPVDELKSICKVMMRNGSAKKIMGGDNNKSEISLNNLFVLFRIFNIYSEYLFIELEC